MTAPYDCERRQAAASLHDRRQRPVARNGVAAPLAGVSPLGQDWAGRVAPAILARPLPRYSLEQPARLSMTRSALGTLILGRPDRRNGGRVGSWTYAAVHGAIAADRGQCADRRPEAQLLDAVGAAGGAYRCRAPHLLDRVAAAVEPDSVVLAERAQPPGADRRRMIRLTREVPGRMVAEQAAAKSRLLAQAHTSTRETR